MAFTVITPAEIAAGEACKQELFDKIRTDFDDHEARIASNEAATASIDPLRWEIDYNYQAKSIADLVGVKYERAQFSFTIQGTRLWLLDTGTSGTLEVDIQLSTNGGASFSSIFSTKPSLTSAAALFDLSTNAVLATTLIGATDILRMDITSKMVSNERFVMILDREVA